MGFQGLWQALKQEGLYDQILCFRKIVLVAACEEGLLESGKTERVTITKDPEALYKMTGKKKNSGKNKIY